MDANKQGGAIFLEGDSTSQTQNEDGSVTEYPSEESVDEDDSFTPDRENVLFCESCGFVKDRKESSWFPGDACPDCKDDYLSAD